MARRVTWTESAGQDLKEIWEYIARDSLMYAGTFVRKAREAARSLNDSSERGRVVPEYDTPDIRELIVGNYRLVYQVTADDVFILRFIHGARQLPAGGREA
jgi:toxin ParE1/3/4